MRFQPLFALLASTALAVPVASGAAVPLPQGAPVAQLVADVNIPYSEFTLANGLRVVINTDRKAPIVAVSVWYHVGSKDEPAGRTGFAHLFEHLMFGGSEHSDQSWFKPMQSIGATEVNGSTYFDRTNYFETVPRGALDTALFLESDRMGHLLGAVTQKKLDIQRGVVENEKRQDDNQPGGLLQYQIFQTLFPAGNPYHHTPIGSMADLSTASLDVVKGWFREHYGPNNAVLVLSGDISAAEARPLVEKYFGDIPRGPQTIHPATSVPTLPAPVTKVFHDQVANTQITRMWTIPGFSSKDAAALDLAASVLGGLGSSRLDDALVRGQKIAVQVSADTSELEGAGMFSVSAVVKPGVDPALVGRQMDAVVAQFLNDGPTATELNRAKTVDVSSTIRGLEKVGGDDGKAVTLAEGAIYANDPGFYKKELDEEAALTPVDVRDAARKWLSRPVFAYTLSPGPRGSYEEAATVSPASPAKPTPPAPKQATGNGNGTSAKAGVDRSQLPPVGKIADLRLPPIERAKLSNGIEVEFARRTAIPDVDIALSFDAGNAADPKGKLGTQSFMLALLGEGTDRYDATQIRQAKENLGALISGSASMDRTRIDLSALTPNLQPSLDLFADVVRRSAFRPADVDRIRAERLAGIAEEMTQPEGLALRILPPLLYGARHPYGVPFTGTGDPAAVATLNAADLRAFSDTWLRPDKATLFVVADTTLAQIMPMLEKSFGDWKASGPAPVKDFDVATPPPSGRIVLIDRPDTPQSLIFGGELMPVKGTDDLIPLLQANDVLGGAFLSRLNMDLRETKHWAYGVQGIVDRVQHTIPYLVYAPVQGDETGPAIAAMRKDMAAFLTTSGVTPEELQRTVDGSIRELPGEFETSAGVLSGMENNELYHRPDDFYETLASHYRALTVPELDQAARKAIDPSKIVWVVIGDKAKVLPQLTPLGLPVQVMAAPGAPVAK